MHPESWRCGRSCHWSVVLRPAVAVWSQTAMIRAGMSPFGPKPQEISPTARGRARTRPRRRRRAVAPDRPPAGTGRRRRAFGVSIASTPRQSGSSGSSARIRSRSARDLFTAPRSEVALTAAVVEVGEVADHRPLLVVRCVRARPVLLDQGPQVARLPAALRRRPRGSAGGTSSPAGGSAASGISPRGRSRGHHPVRVGLGDRREQRLGVRVPGVGEDLRRSAPISTTRPRYMIAIRSQKYFARGQVVGDVDVGQPELAA